MASPEQLTSDDSRTLSIESFGSDFSSAARSVNEMTNDFMAMLPKLVIAAIVFLIFILIAYGLRKALEYSFSKDSRKSNLKSIFGRLTNWGVIFIGLMVSVAIVAPSVTPAKLLSVLGFGGVAIGFAFKDILQNFLAGILILLRQPFSIGDQVVLGSFEGTVENIETRSTIIKTYDGTRVHVPNGLVYTNPMVILTAYADRRSEYEVGIGYGDDIDLAVSTMLEAIKNVQGVRKTPEPDVLTVALAGSTVNLRARWWSDPQRADVLSVQHKVIRAIKLALDKAAIDMPYPTQVLLIHDQTEETDGDRTRQREGWPAGQNPPKARRSSIRLDSSNKSSSGDN
ncbi:MAG: mechanosensitive ion channel family protein [Proteobacteria bacterium]|nr:MAG: mechanosensitive ion channel family protein [Pseudomonadota bacterium]